MSKSYDMNGMCRTKGKAEYIERNLTMSQDSAHLLQHSTKLIATLIGLIGL